ncbi:hypothetical protein F7D01_10605 [Erythrobacter sp. 3-20A1M]|uniref:hypothetical protein n=1 Tax=Erythrobacter sp. 3-20A1M TaxID=2653850 RepID=UPI001BFC4AC7|nr:hypothetical protein [Erythrobacter sp. 3-20A1M]QWC57472.1 hypothetical protein F7D01_10605 [Erythrobacter sp. 3-20A1M]
MVKRKNTGLAVSDAKRLNDCFNELSEAIASRPPLKGDERYWAFDYRAIALNESKPEAYMHRCGSRDIALVALRGAVTNDNLQLWTNGPHGEAKIDRYELKELTFATFKSGTYQPDNRRLDNAGLAESPLWVKETDWRQYMSELWAVRYGIDWANPAPPADEPLLPPEGQFVTLSHALSWVAFGVSMDSDQLHEVLTLDQYGEHDPQEGIKAALAQLIERGRAGRIAMEGKYRESHRDDKRTLLTAAIEPIKFADFQQFNYVNEELKHGDGLWQWRQSKIVELRGNRRGGRPDSFIEVGVNRADLLREFRPQKAHVSESDHFRVAHTFNRDDPANIAPWWSINQALAWVARRIPSYVEYIGNLETDEPREYRPYIVQAICESQVAESDEGKAFMETRRAAWPDGTFLAHAGRDFLEKILSGEVRPMARQNGQGRQMRAEEFVGIGARATGGDWLDLDPQPLFASAEVMRVFPASEHGPAGAGGGIVPANRQLDHAAIMAKAGAMLSEQPNLSKGSAAVSIVAELPPNPRTGKPRDTRHIERMIAPLWEGGFSQSPG